MLILEGPDLVGKTTLANKLVKDQWMKSEGMVYRHLSRMPAGFRFPQQYGELVGRKTVYDRFHMSEPCYAYARGEQGSALDPEMYRLVDGWLRGLGAYIVVITADEELIRERYAKRAAEEMYPVDFVLKANQAFIEMVRANKYSRECVDVAYQPDFDLHIHLEKGRSEFVSDGQAQLILHYYKIRQSRVDCVHLKSGAHGNYGYFRG